MDFLREILAILGLAIFYNLIFSSLLWMGIIFTIKFFPKLSTKRLSNLSFIAIVTSFVTFILSLPFINTVHPFSNVTIPIILKNSTAFSLIAGLYIMILFWQSYKFYTELKKVYQIRHLNLQRIEARLKIFTETRAKQLSIRRIVAIQLSSKIITPITLGFIKPIILLPVALVNQLSTDQVEAIILHELAHIKNNDYLKNLLAQIAKTVLCFNPFINSLYKIMDVEREKNADELVVQFNYDSASFLAGLVTVAKYKNQRNIMVINAASSDTLLQRTLWMLGHTQRQIQGFSRLLYFSFFLIGVSFLVRNNAAEHRFSSLHHINNLAIPYLSYKTIATNDKVATNDIRITQKNKPKYIPTIYEAEDIDNTVTPELPLQYVATRDIVLSPNEEKNVKNAIESTKRILIESKFNLLDKAFAETVTSQNKIELKQAILNKAKDLDWSDMEYKLKLNYPNLNWSNINKELDGKIAVIKFDSIKMDITLRIDQIKSTLSKNDSNNVQLKNIQLILKKMDSVKKARTIVEL